MNKWETYVAAIVGRRVLVVGDVMIDRYAEGKVRRLCPEAPVPVVSISDRDYGQQWEVPGGAANAATGIECLGGKAVLIGVVGNDQNALDFLRLTAGSDPRIYVDPTRPTTSKLRVLVDGRQMIRVDHESTVPIAAKVADHLATWAEREMPEVDAVLLSDYGKGVLTPELCQRVIAAARVRGCPVVVDPHGTDPSRYRGATVIKPNAAELVALTRSRNLPAALPGTAILNTRGADGMELHEPHLDSPTVFEATARMVRDVTGAGDTVAATLTLALAAGVPLPDAARLANAAAGLVVGKLGTATVWQSELGYEVRAWN